MPEADFNMVADTILLFAGSCVDDLSFPGAPLLDGS